MRAPGSRHRHRFLTTLAVIVLPTLGLVTLSGFEASAEPTGPTYITKTGNSNPTTECVEIASA